MMRLAVDADKDGVIVGTNGDVEAMTGWSEADLVGRDLDVLIPKKYRERHHLALDTYAATGKKKIMGTWVEVEVLHSDGSTTPIMLVLTEKAGMLQGFLETLE